MKVCFFIATIGRCQGGHYIDLRTITAALRPYVDCIVVAIGPDRSPVLDAIPEGVYNVFFNGLNVIGAMREVSRILKQEQIDLLNCYDLRVNGFARLASIILRKPMLFTKCGGPNPRRFYPYSDYLVVFSKENSDHFRNHRKYKNSEVYLLPNRTARAKPDPDRIEKLRSQIDPQKPTFLIISRFCKAYRNMMIQGANLVKRLNADAIPCQLLIIGVPEDPEVVAEIASRSVDGDICIVLDEKFTLNASCLIDVADFVIGAGRGFMEVASRGVILLTTLADSDLPLLVTSETFSDVFATNFSPRNRVKGFDANQNYRDIAWVVENFKSNKRYNLLAERLFEECFSVESVVRKYQEIFAGMRYRRRFYLADVAFGFLSFWRSKAYFKSVK